MQDWQLIPVSEPAKTKADVVTLSGALLGYFKAIPWPELAAAAAFLYTVIRILELLIGWYRKRK